MGSIIKSGKPMTVRHGCIFPFRSFLGKKRLVPPLIEQNSLLLVSDTDPDGNPDIRSLVDNEARSSIELKETTRFYYMSKLVHEFTYTYKDIIESTENYDYDIIISGSFRITNPTGFMKWAVNVYGTEELYLESDKLIKWFFSSLKFKFTSEFLEDNVDNIREFESHPPSWWLHALNIETVKSGFEFKIVFVKFTNPQVDQIKEDKEKIRLMDELAKTKQTLNSMYLKLEQIRIKHEEKIRRLIHDERLNTMELENELKIAQRKKEAESLKYEQKIEEAKVKLSRIRQKKGSEVEQSEEFVLDTRVGRLRFIACSSGMDNNVGFITPVYLMETPVSQGLWHAIMGSSIIDQIEIAEDIDDSMVDVHESYPMILVSWEEACIFIAKLNDMYPGFKFSLPKPSEWDLASGITGSTSLDIGATIRKLFPSTTRHLPVSQYPTSIHGHKGMFGCVWQWCIDSANISSEHSASNPKRLVKGGSYFNDPSDPTIYQGREWDRHLRNIGLGFRIAAHPDN